MKLTPPTDYELEFIKWRIWEPLRRNQEYRTEYAKLKVNIFLDQTEEEYFLKEDAFLKKWKLPFAVDPNCEFEKLHPPQWTFWEHYKPLFDHAAFADNAMTEQNFIVNGKYLKVWVDLTASRNQIEAALKKELDEWRKQWTIFYGGQAKRKISGRAVHIRSEVSKYVGLFINLEAPRTTSTKSLLGYIEPEMKVILTECLSKWEGTKEKVPRLHTNKWASCFKVYDLVRSGQSYFDISIKLRKDLSPKERESHIYTLRKQYNRAKESIYGEKAHPEEEHPCILCTDRLCENTEKLCSQYLDFLQKEQFLFPLERSRKEPTLEQAEWEISHEELTGVSPRYGKKIRKRKTSDKAFD